MSPREFYTRVAGFGSRNVRVGKQTSLLLRLSISLAKAETNRMMQKLIFRKRF